MNSTILTLRAITAVYFQRLLTWAGLIVGGILLLGYLMIILLVTQVSAWWWLLFAILFPVTVLAFLMFLGLSFLANKLLPRKITHEERRSLRRITDISFGFAEKTKTPLPLLFIWLAKDVVRGRESTLVRNTLNESTELREEFSKVQRIFS